MCHNKLQSKIHTETQIQIQHPRWVAKIKSDSDKKKSTKNAFKAKSAMCHNKLQIETETQTQIQIQYPIQTKNTNTKVMGG